MAKLELSEKRQAFVKKQKNTTTLYAQIFN